MLLPWQRFIQHETGSSCSLRYTCTSMCSHYSGHKKSLVDAGGALTLMGPEPHEYSELHSGAAGKIPS